MSPAQQATSWQDADWRADHEFLIHAAGEPVMKCPRNKEPIREKRIDFVIAKHWIQVYMRREPGMRLPVEPEALQPYGDEFIPYRFERFASQLTCGRYDDALDGWGEIRIDGIPAGTCHFRFIEFYNRVENELRADTASTE